MLGEQAILKGRYEFECIALDGSVRWREVIDNVVCTLGKNEALDVFLSGVNYTVTGPYMGLISATGFTGVAASDTMLLHPGWVEAGNANQPTYSPPRGTCVFAAASGGSKALASALTFSMTSAGTVQGGFITYGPGAVNTIDATSGILLSASSFLSGPRPVNFGDVLNVSYSLSM